MPPHKSEDYKISAVQYYLSKNKNQVQTCEIFQCHPRSLTRVLKSKLQKKEGLTYNHLQSNIENVLRDIPLITFKNIFKGVYERPEKYKPKNKTRKIKKNYL